MFRLMVMGLAMDMDMLVVALEHSYCVAVVEHCTEGVLVDLEIAGEIIMPSLALTHKFFPKGPSVAPRVGWYSYSHLNHMSTITIDL